VHSTKHSKTHRKKPRTKQGHFYDRDYTGEEELQDVTTVASSGKTSKERTRNRNSDSHRRDGLDFVYNASGDNNGNSHSRSITTVGSDTSTSHSHNMTTIVTSFLLVLVVKLFSVPGQG